MVDSGDSTSGRGKSTAETIANLAGGAAVAYAALVYFGWARARASFDYLGVPLSVVQLGQQDYALRSVQSVYIPALAATLAGFFLTRWGPVLRGKLKPALQITTRRIFVC